MPGQLDIDVVDNPAKQRFEARVQGELAIAEYERKGDTIFFMHTEVPQQLRGRGIGQALAHGALEQARSEGSRVVAYCRFIAAYIDRHPEYGDLVAEKT